MPMRPQRPCQHPGCGRLGKTTYCQAHQRQRWREESAHRDRKGGRSWRKLRDRKLRAYPICELCKRALATEVHHVEPVAKAPEREFDWGNLQAVCVECHKVETAAEQGTA